MLFTKADMETIYISEMLGQLIKSGFLPEQDLSRGWGVLSQKERNKLITWARTKMALLELQKERSEGAQRPAMSMAQTLANKEAAKAQNAYIAAQGRKLDLSVMSSLKAMD